MSAGELERDYLPISAVAEVLYCPRNFYYRVTEGAREQNHHVLQGKFEEERREERETVSRPGTVQRRGQMIASERLRLIGIVDALEERNDIYPVEYKKGEAGDKIHDQVQLCAQAMVLEEVLDRPIQQGYVYYGESRIRVPVEFTEDLRELVLKTIDTAFRILESGEIPEPVNDVRCTGCSLQERCLPSEVQFLHKKGEAPTRPLPGVNLGRVLYVDEPGAYIRKSGERLVVTKDQTTLREIPAVNLDEVVLAGQVNLSTSAHRMLLEHEIPVSFLSPHGNYEGRLQPACSRNAVLRIAQVQVHLDPAARLQLARQFVAGKLANMRTVLVRHRRTHNSEELVRAIRELSASAERATGATELAVLRGIEGMGSRHYFSVLNSLLRPDLPFAFERRTRRPPTDPVNALLSFAYALLTKEAVAALGVAGLDPYVGFLHEAKYGRPALALDLVEEFRPHHG